METYGEVCAGQRGGPDNRRFFKVAEQFGLGLLEALALGNTGIEEWLALRIDHLEQNPVFQISVGTETPANVGRPPAAGLQRLDDRLPLLLCAAPLACDPGLGLLHHEPRLSQHDSWGGRFRGGGPRG